MKSSIYMNGINFNFVLFSLCINLFFMIILLINKSFFIFIE